VVVPVSGLRVEEVMLGSFFERGFEAFNAAVSLAIAEPLLIGAFTAKENPAETKTGEKTNGGNEDAHFTS
jgi:hypothetical protein